MCGIATPVAEATQSAHMMVMTTLTAYAKAAQHLPMAWLTQSLFPAKDLVESSFRDALAELPAPEGYEDNLVRSAMETVIAGPDPRGGKFQAQAIQAAAKLHDRVITRLLEAPGEGQD